MERNILEQALDNLHNNNFKGTKVDVNRFLKRKPSYLYTLLEFSKKHPEDQFGYTWNNGKGIVKIEIANGQVL